MTVLKKNSGEQTLNVTTDIFQVLSCYPPNGLTLSTIHFCAVSEPEAKGKNRAKNWFSGWPGRALRRGAQGANSFFRLWRESVPPSALLLPASGLLPLLRLPLV